MITMFMRMDAKTTIFNRRVKSLSEAVAQGGGIYSVLTMVGYFIVYYFKTNLYKSALIEKFYQYKKRAYHKKEFTKEEMGDEGEDRGKFDMLLKTYAKSGSNVFGKDKDAITCANPVRRLCYNERFLINKNKHSNNVYQI